MNRYIVAISEQAQQDLRDLSNVISFEYKSPLTAIKYLRGIYDEMRKLQLIADFLPIQKSAYFQQYGYNIRRLKYKKMTIIYTVTGNTVYIVRVVPSSTIKSY
jgi:plasmid stabilization system protein ParE